MNKSNNTPSVLQALQEALDLTTRAREEKLRALDPLYGFTQLEAVIVAMLAETPKDYVSMPTLITRLTSYYVRESISLEEWDTVGSLKHLQSQGVIIYDVSSGRVRLTDSAYEAFQEGRPIHGTSVPVETVEDMLFEMDPAELLKPGALERFKNSFQKPENKAFAAASLHLGLECLTDREQRFFWINVRHFLHDETEPCSLKRLKKIYDNERDILRLASVLVERCLLFRGACLECDSPDEAYGFSLTPRAVKALFPHHVTTATYAGISRYATVLRSGNIEEIPLFYTEEVSRQMESIESLLSPGGFARAQEILQRQKRNPAILILLYGPPGTGKTEAARQLARQSGRDLLQLNVGNMLFSNWGDSEKCYQAVFDRYAEIVASSPYTPILFLNEADNLLSRRLTSLDKSIDKGENNLTTILLQAFEKMSGILIATTNHKQLLDEAFDRRFLLKVELGAPGLEARKRIWASNLPDLAPDTISTIAAKYVMTGSQIANVATKWSLAEILSVTRNEDYLDQLCREELGIKNIAASPAAPSNNRNLMAGVSLVMNSNPYHS